MQFEEASDSSCDLEVVELACRLAFEDKACVPTGLRVIDAVQGLKAHIQWWPDLRLCARYG